MIPQGQQVILRSKINLSGANLEDLTKSEKDQVLEVKRKYIQEGFNEWNYNYYV